MRKPRTTYVAGQDNIKLLGMDVHHPVFAVSVALILLFVVYTLSLQSQAETFFHGLLARVVGDFDWFFIMSANCFFLFSLFLAFSPLGRVRLGGQDAMPD